MDGWYIGVPLLVLMVITFANLLEARLKPLGMGKSVYWCLPSGSNLYLTLKQLKSMTLSSSEFRCHINLLEGIDHDHILPIRAYCYDQDYKFILYDFVLPGSLFNLIHDRGPLHLDDIIWISLDVASGIKHLHDNNISHGNVKSSNVVVSDDMHVLLSAFGHSTHHHGSQEDDVYNFGVLLLELLCRRNPKLDLLLLALDCLDKKCNMFLVTQKIGELQKELCKNHQNLNIPKPNS